jgi:hypothetical protein
MIEHPALPLTARRTFEQLMLEPLTDPAQLAQAVAQYAASFSVDVASNDFVDSGQVQALSDGCLALLALWENVVTDEERRLIQAAVQYFLLEGDGDEDRSIGGFYDDVMVFNDVASRLGHAELCIAPG